MEDTKTPFFINAAFNVLHLSLGTFLFMNVKTNQKVAALALAYSISYFVVWLFTWRRVAKANPMLNFAAQTRLFTQVTVAALISLGISWAATEFITAFTPSNALGIFLQLVTLGVTFVGAYVYTARQMHVPEVADLKSLLNR